MPDNGIRLADLSTDQKKMIRDAVIYNVESDCPLLKYVNKVTVEENAQSLSLRRVIPSEIDKTTDAYKHGLAEGTNPTPSKLRKQLVTVDLQRWADACEFTKKAYKHSASNVLADVTKELSSHAAQYISEKVADAFLSTTNRVTSITFSSVSDFDSLTNILLVNKAKPIDGYFNLVVCPTLYTKIRSTFYSQLENTSEKEAPVTGRVEYLFGFRLIPLALQALAPTGTSYPFFAFGMNGGNDYPVTQAAYGDGNGNVIEKEFGTVRENDYTNEWGALSIEFEGTNCAVTDDSVLVAGTATVSGLTAPTKFDFSNASNVELDNVSPSGIVLSLTSVSVKDGGTATLTAYKADGTPWTTGASVASTDASVATAAFGSANGIVTVTAKKPGVCHLIVSETSDPTHAAICTVQVTGPVADGD